MELNLTVKEVVDRGIWEEVCKLKGINEYVLNEGLMDSEDVITLNENEAKKLNIIK